MFDKKPEPGTCLYWYEGNECVELSFGTKITLKEFQSYERDIGVPVTFEVSDLEKERVGLLALLIYETLKNLHDVVTIRIGRLAVRFDTVDVKKIFLDEQERLAKGGANTDKDDDPYNIHGRHLAN
jgi:hypothetical protein